jgi:hypothetical protein
MVCEYATYLSPTSSWVRIRSGFTFISLGVRLRLPRRSTTAGRLSTAWEGPVVWTCAFQSPPALRGSVCRGLCGPTSFPSSYVLGKVGD